MIFILVHGAWHGGWCWSRVAPVLRAAEDDHLLHTLRFVHRLRRVPAFRPFGDRARADPSWRYREIAAGHDAMVTRPRELATILLELTRAG